MFTLLNTVLLIVLLIQVVKCRRDLQEIDCPAAKEVLKMKNRIKNIH